MSETDICIIGAGIMGSATAYYLSKITNKQIILVDRYNVANDYCSSNDINRVFRYAYGKDEFYTRLAIQSRKLWQQLEQETKLQLLIPSDLLLVCVSRSEEHTSELQSRSDLVCRLLLEK